MDKNTTNGIVWFSPFFGVAYPLINIMAENVIPHITGQFKEVPITSKWVNANGVSFA